MFTWFFGFFPIFDEKKLIFLKKLSLQHYGSLYMAIRVVVYIFDVCNRHLGLIHQIYHFLSLALSFAISRQFYLLGIGILLGVVGTLLVRPVHKIESSRPNVLEASQADKAIIGATSKALTSAPNPERPLPPEPSVQLGNASSSASPSESQTITPNLADKIRGDLPQSIKESHAAVPLQQGMPPSQSTSSDTPTMGNESSSPSNDTLALIQPDILYPREHDPSNDRESDTKRVTLRFAKGDTLASLLRSLQLAPRTQQALIEELNKYTPPNQYQIGDSFDITLSNDKGADGFVALMGLVFPKTKLESIVVEPQGSEFTSYLEYQELITERRLLHGTIEGSIWQVSEKFSVPDDVRSQVISLLSYGLDLQREIHTGDELEVIYDIQRTKNGDIVSSNYVHYVGLRQADRTKRYFRFRTQDGIIEYFDEQARSLKALLMRTPIDGARLSSHFGKRKHPILGYTKMHKGTDFAAPKGTKIYAAGDGTITRAGWSASYGNVIKIKHRDGYETLYAHMSKFARGIRTGRRVSQGQVIGYVGSTGRSSGPHLHYEVIAKGRHVNPMKLNLPTGAKLNQNEENQFAQLVEKVDQLYSSYAQKNTSLTLDDQSVNMVATLMDAPIPTPRPAPQ